MSKHEEQGTGYDSGAFGYELQGRKKKPPEAPIEHFNIDDLDPIKQQRRNQREFDRERRDGWAY